MIFMMTRSSTSEVIRAPELLLSATSGLRTFFFFFERVNVKLYETESGHNFMPLKLEMRSIYKVGAIKEKGKLHGPF